MVISGGGEDYRPRDNSARPTSQPLSSVRGFHLGEDLSDGNGAPIQIIEIPLGQIPDKAVIDPTEDVRQQLGLKEEK